MKNIKNIPIKYLSFGLKSKSGINNLGRKTVKTKSSGKSKRKFRILDFYRNRKLMPFVLRMLQYQIYTPNTRTNTSTSTLLWYFSSRSFHVLYILILT